MFSLHSRHTHARTRFFDKTNRSFSPLARMRQSTTPARFEDTFMASGSPLILYPHGGHLSRAVCPTAPSPVSRPSARRALDRLARPREIFFRAGVFPPRPATIGRSVLCMPFVSTCPVVSRYVLMLSRPSISEKQKARLALDFIGQNALFKWWR